MARYEVEVAGVTYVGETASAVSQFDAFDLACNSRLLVGMQEDVSDKVLVLTVMGMTREQRKELEGLLIKGKVFRNDVPVGINLFDGEIHNYALLLGKVARENLAGFFDLSDKGMAEENQAEANGEI